MDVTYFGAGCVRFQTKQLTAFVNPYEKQATGLALPKTKPDVVFFSHQLTETPDLSASMVINTPGEYEIKGVSVQGISAQSHVDKEADPKQAIIYRFQYRDISTLYVGHIAPELTQEQLEAIGEVHAIIVPVGGHGLTLDGQAASELVSRFEPHLIIPIHYDDGKTKYEVAQDNLETFLKEIGGEKTKPVPKIKISGRTLPEDSEVVVLENSAKK